MEGGPIVVTLGGSIAPAHVSVLWERIRWLARPGTVGEVVCDVADLVDPDAAAIEALARLQLLARRSGFRICLLHAGPRLRELLDLMGLAEVVPCDADLRIQSRRQPEQGEPPGGVEEEGDPTDPVA
jgi:anti-anti-sigma regulatory factor